MRVGSNGNIKFLCPKTRVLDLDGKTVVPGFIDAHAHPRPIYDEDSPWYNIEAGPNKIKTMEDLIAAIRRKAGKTPKGMLDHRLGLPRNQVGPTADTTGLGQGHDRPSVIITHSSGHLSVCNSTALKLAKVTRDTSDPKGGEFQVTKGEPTGLLKERAAGIVRSSAPRQEVPDADKVAGYRTCLRLFLANGLTGVHVAGTDPSSAQLLTAAEGLSGCAGYIMLREGNIDRAVELKRDMAADEWGVRYGAIKSFYGNSLSGHDGLAVRPVHQSGRLLRPSRARPLPRRSRGDGPPHPQGWSAIVHSLEWGPRDRRSAGRL